MSLKNAKLADAAAVVLGLTVDGGVVVDQLDNLTIGAVDGVEVDQSGNAVMFVSVANPDKSVSVKVVCDAMGAPRLFNGASAIVQASRKCGAAPVSLTKMARTVSLGDPVKALVSKHKQATAESVRSAANKTELTNKVAACAAQGWNTAAVGTQERDSYDMWNDQKSVVTVWDTANTARKADLAAALTSAGIDPTTYGPL